MKYGKNCLSIRIAGNYTCKHLPWHNNFYLELLDDEYDNYLINNKSTNYWIDKNKKQIKQDIKPEIKPEIKLEIINFNNLIDDNLEKNKLLAINIGSCNFIGNYFKYIINIDNNEILNENNILNYSKISTFKNFIDNNNLLKDNINNIALINCNINNQNIIDELIEYSIIHNIKLYLNNILYKKQEYITIPIIILGNNFNEKQINKIIDKLEKYTKNIIVVYDKDIECKYQIYKDKSYEKIIGDIYIITSADELNIEFNKNFKFEDLIKISEYYQAEKIGFVVGNEKLIYKFYLPDFNYDIWLSEIKDNRFQLINKKNIGGHYKIAYKN
jgi:hypothetical protein